MGLAGADLGFGKGNAPAPDDIEDMLRQLQLLLPQGVTMQGQNLCEDAPYGFGQTGAIRPVAGSFVNGKPAVSRMDNMLILAAMSTKASSPKRSLRRLRISVSQRTG